MRFSQSVIVLVAAGLASAQLPNIPQCSLNCFVSALSSDGCSSLTDFACHCEKTQLVSEVTPCVEKACDVADQKAVSSIVVSECSAAGHPVTIPAIGGGGSGSGTTKTGDHTDHTHTKTGSESSATPTGSASSSPAVSTPASSSKAVGTGGKTPSKTTPGSPVFTGAAGRTEGSLAGAALAAAMGGFALL